MAIKIYKRNTAGRRNMSIVKPEGITDKRPEKSLTVSKKNFAGRSGGKISVRHRGGGHKRLYRLVDFRQNKWGIPGKVASLEKDPNRSGLIALIHYFDGEKRYILAPVGLRVGQTVMSGLNAEIAPGNSLPIRNIPPGQNIHNIELKKGHGGQLCRSAGVSAQLAGKEGDYALLKMPSGEMRKVRIDCFATIGSLSNPDHINLEIGKAGRSRWLNRRPHNRGVTKNPVDHPMGGGEGKTSGGRQPVSQTGVQAKGLKTRSNKRTDKYIVRRRGKKK